MTSWFNCNTDIIQTAQLIDGHPTYSTQLISDIQGNLYCLVDTKLYEKWYLKVNKIQGLINRTKGTLVNEFSKLNDEWYLQPVTLWDQNVHIISYGNKYGNNYIKLLSKKWNILWRHYLDPNNNAQVRLFQWLPVTHYDSNTNIITVMSNNQIALQLEYTQ